MEKIEDREVPRYIYKYMSLDGFIEMATQGSLYFASPTTYNDPFDTKANVKGKASPEEIKSFWSKLGYGDEEINKIKQLPSSSLNEIANNEYRKILSDFRVCCFSQISDSILMWSHYSDMHKGVCVKFDRNKDSLFDSSRLISYEEQVPEYNFITGTNDDVNRVIYTKSAHWEYEKEIRIVKHAQQGFTNKVTFKKKALSEVIFGCRFPEHKKLAVQAILKKYAYHVTLSQMDTSVEEYKLIKENIQL